MREAPPQDARKGPILKPHLWSGLIAAFLNLRQNRSEYWINILRQLVSECVFVQVGLQIPLNALRDN